MATRMGTGVGKEAAGRQSGAAAARAARVEMGSDAPDLVIVFASPLYDHAEVLQGVRSVTGDVPLIGCSSAGEFTERGVLSQSVVVAAICSDTMRFTIGCGRGLGQNLSRAVSEAIGGFRASSPESLRAGLIHRTILLFADGLGGGGEALINELMMQTALQYQLAGGAAGDDVKFHKTPVFYRDEVLTNAFVCAEILSPVRVGLGISHGWGPIGPKMRVTRSEGLAIKEINGRPALDIYREFARQQGIALEGKAVVPFLMEHIIGWLYQEGEQKLRVTLWPLDDGSVVCASEVPEGALISLMKATDQSVIDASGQASRLAIQDLQSAPPAGIIVLECVSQKLRVGATGIDEELRRIQQAVGSIPLAGCHGYGQLARTRGAFTGLMSASALVCLFPQA
ncbi:MAG TPA: FIST N-terminal domain-containing protein [Candidatus Binatia bacterium]